MHKKTIYILAATLGATALVWSQNYTVSFMLGDVTVKKAAAQKDDDGLEELAED